jgi:nucleoside-diphosphate-sugar epimerase
MNVLVIGGTRFIGAAVVRRLSELGYHVTVLHRGITEPPLPRGVRHHHGDRSVSGALEAAVVASEPDVVLDMVAFTESEAEEAAQVLTGRVPRVVVASSLDVYRAYERFAGLAPGPPEPTPIDEEAPLCESRYPRRSSSGSAPAHGGVAPLPSVRHDYDKVLVERAYRSAAELQVTVLRLPFVYGPGDYRRRVGQLLRRMQSAEVITLSAAEAAWRATRGYVENIAAATVLALADTRAAGRIYNLGDTTGLTTARWAGYVARAAGWTGEVRVEADRGPVLGSWAQDLELDTSRLRRELGFEEPVRLDEALRRTVIWEREQ